MAGWMTEGEFQTGIMSQGRVYKKTLLQVPNPGFVWTGYNNADVFGTGQSTYQSELNEEWYDHLHWNLDNMYDKLVAKQEEQWKKVENKYDQMMEEFKSLFEILSKHVNNVAECNTDSIKLQLLQELDPLKQELGRLIKEQTSHSGSDPLLQDVSTHCVIPATDQKVTLESPKVSGVDKPNKVSIATVKSRDHLPGGSNVTYQIQNVSDFGKSCNFDGEVTDQNNQPKERDLELTRKHGSMSDFDKQDNTANTKIKHNSHPMSALDGTHHLQSVSSFTKPNNVASTVINQSSHLMRTQKEACQKQSLPVFTKPNNAANVMTSHTIHLLSDSKVIYQQQYIPDLEEPDNVESTVNNYSGELMSARKVTSQQTNVTGYSKPNSVADAEINNNNQNKQKTNNIFKSSDKNIYMPQEQEESPFSDAYFQGQNRGKQHRTMPEKVQGVTSDKNIVTEVSKDVQVKSYSHVVQSSTKAQKENLSDESEFNKAKCSSALDVYMPRTSSMIVLRKGTFEATGAYAEIIANQMKQLKCRTESL